MHIERWPHFKVICSAFDPMFSLLSHLSPEPNWVRMLILCNLKNRKKRTVELSFLVFDPGPFPQRVGKSMKRFVAFITDKRTVCRQRRGLYDGSAFVHNEAWIFLSLFVRQWNIWKSNNSCAVKLRCPVCIIYRLLVKLYVLRLNG